MNKCKLKGEDVENYHFSPPRERLIVDFKNAIVNSAISVKGKLPTATHGVAKKNSIIGAAAGHLDRIWNRQSLLPMGKESKKDVAFLEFLNERLTVSNIAKFVEKNIDILPKKQ